MRCRVMLGRCSRAKLLVCSKQQSRWLHADAQCTCSNSSQRRRFGGAAHQGRPRWSAASLHPAGCRPAAAPASCCPAAAWPPAAQVNTGQATRETRSLLLRALFHCSRSSSHMLHRMWHMWKVGSSWTIVARTAVWGAEPSPARCCTGRHRVLPVVRVVVVLRQLLHDVA
jgi:hypothetical protein